MPQPPEPDVAMDPATLDVVLGQGFLEGSIAGEASPEVVALAPHPDDAEMGCGGALARLVDAGVSVAIIDLCAGEAASRGTAAIRRAESVLAARRLGVRLRVQLGGRDGRLEEDLHGRRSAGAAGPRTPFTGAPLFRRLSGLLAVLRPRLLFLPSSEGPPGSPSHDRHPDHRAVARLRGPLEGLDPFGIGVEHRVGYPIHGSLPPNRERFAVQVGMSWARRLRALGAHRSQLGAHGPWPPTALSHRRWIRSHLRRSKADARTLGVGGRVEWVRCLTPGARSELEDLLGGPLLVAPGPRDSGGAARPRTESRSCRFLARAAPPLVAPPRPWDLEGVRPRTPTS